MPYNNDNSNNIKLLSKSIIVSILKCSCSFLENWNEMDFDEKKDILESVSDVLYDWLSARKKQPRIIK